MNLRLDIMPPLLTSIDVFCGGGGASLGTHKAGFTSVLAIDVNTKALECYHANNPSVPILHRPVQYINAQDVFKITGLKQGQLDHLHGSPPCKLYSTANPRAASNPPEHINANFYEFIRLIDEIKPKTFTMENVDGMMKGMKTKYFNDIIKKLHTLKDYEFRYKVLNSGYYTVPQDRLRVIFVGKRKDITPNISISFPKPNVEGTKYLTVKMVAPYIERYDSTQFGPKIKDNNHLMCTIVGMDKMKVCVAGKWREMTVPETKLFMGFPKDYVLPAKSRYVNVRILGNAVPPPMMKAIMLSVRKMLGEQGKDNKTLSLYNPA
jgi:site-specific DNA-cytosine methylase